MTVKRWTIILLVLTFILAVAPATGTTPHTLYGTISAQSCLYFPGLNPDWTCWASVTENDIGAETFAVEVEGEALGQIAQLVLPRRAYLTFKIVPAGIDYLRGIVRTQIRVYYILDAGPVP